MQQRPLRPAIAELTGQAGKRCLWAAPAMVRAAPEPAPEGEAVTWSIIARDEPKGRVGIVVATMFFAVGAMVPHIRTGVGAIASQAFMNPLYGPQGLALLEAGVGAEET